MNIPLFLSEDAAALIARLEENGFEACTVGGCVRDALRGETPHDWDIGTAALPEDTLRCFADCPVIETGLKHGTVTVLWRGKPFEITTYRVEKGYADGRHPDEVAFVRRLEDDLARRDFTINAMAYHPVRGLTDLFGGQADLAAGIVRCVGEADRRFREDALRILRGLRFAACLGFAVEEAAARAMRGEQGRLRGVSAERVNAELCRLLTGRNAAGTLRAFADVIGTVLPETAPMRGFLQNNPHHCRDVWEHTLTALETSPPDRLVRLALLFHDSGKPFTYTEDESGVGHFHGHPAVSGRLADRAMRRLRFDTETRERVCRLVRIHDIPAENEPRFVRRWLNRLGEEDFRRLLAVKRADTLGQAPRYQPPRLTVLDGLEQTLEDILRGEDCFRLRDLAVGGRDLLAEGMSEGPAVGEALRFLLDGVLDGRFPNERGPLLEALRNRGGKTDAQR